MSAKNKVTVSIFDREYTILGDDDTMHIVKVAETVDKRMRTLAKRSPTLSENRVSVLTSLNLADELIKQQGDENSPGTQVKTLEIELHNAKQRLNDANRQITELQQLLSRQKNGNR